jgi:hypothetical protein
VSCVDLEISTSRIRRTRTRHPSPKPQPPAKNTTRLVAPRDQVVPPDSKLLRVLKPRPAPPVDHAKVEYLVLGLEVAGVVLVEQVAGLRCSIKFIVRFDVKFKFYVMGGWGVGSGWG